MIEFKEGDYITCEINGIEIKDARIHFKDKGRVMICLCQDVVEGTGGEHYGYHNSYTIGHNQSELNRFKVKIRSLRCEEGGNLTKEKK